MVDKSASELVRKRWNKTTPQERSETMSEVSRARWDNMTEEERKAHGAMLAKARAKKRAGKKAKK